MSPRFTMPLSRAFGLDAGNARPGTMFLSVYRGSAPNPTYRVEEPFAPEGNTSAETYGVETSVNWRALESLNLSASHSLLAMALHNDTGHRDARRRSRRRKTIAEIPGQPACRMGRHPKRRFVRYDAVLYQRALYPNFQVGSHMRLDMRLGWRIMPTDWNSAWSGRICSIPRNRNSPRRRTGMCCPSTSTAAFTVN